MTFVPVPNTGQTLDGTRDQIRTNIGLLKSSLAVNHGDLGNVDTGKHKFLQMPIQAGSPSTAVNELGFFSLLVGGINVLAMREANNGSAYALTGITPLATPNGYTPLIGSLLLQWGVVAAPASTGTVLFTTSNIDFPNNLFGVFFNFARNASGTDSFWIDSTQVFDKTQFSWKASTGAANNLYWIAIGN